MIRKISSEMSAVLDVMRRVNNCGDDAQHEINACIVVMQSLAHQLREIQAKGAFAQD